MSLVRRLLFRCQRDGTLATFRGLLYALKPVMCGYYFRDLDPLEVPPTSAGDPRIETDLRLLRSRLSTLDISSTPWAFKLDLVYRASRVYFICDGERPVSLLWMFAGANASKYFALREGEAELAGLFVEPEYRKLGHAKALLRYACRDLAAHGYRRLYSVIDEWNVASQRAVYHTGWFKMTKSLRAHAFGPRFIPEWGRVQSWTEFLRGRPRIPRGSRLACAQEQTWLPR